MKKAQSGKLPPEFLSLLSLGKVQKSLVPKSKRNLAGRTVAMRVNTARRMMKANGEVIPSYLTKPETRRLLLIGSVAKLLNDRRKVCDRAQSFNASLNRSEVN